MGSWGVSSWLLFALLVSGATSCYSPTMPCYGKVSPDVSYVFRGENVSLTCTINEGSGLKVEDFHFLINDTMAPQKYVTATTNRTLVINYPAERCANGTLFYCQSTTVHPLHNAGYSVVVIDHKPVIVSNNSIHCRVQNWNAMICTWDVETDFCYPENVDVKLYYRLQNILDLHGCPSQTSTSCEWRDADFHIDKHYHLLISLKYKNRGFWNMPQWHSITADNQIVEPNTVKNLMIDLRNSSAALVSWIAPNIEKIEYRIKWKSEYLESWESVTTNLTTLDVNSLRPYARYNISIDCRPLCDDVGCGYWSVPTRDDFQMPENIPGAPPQTTNGSIYNMHCEGHGCRKTRVYWKSIPNELKHGVIITHEVKYREQKAGSEWSIMKVSVDETSVDLISLSAAAAYEVHINSRTKVGFAANPSVIYLASLEKGLKTPDNFIVQEDLQRGTKTVNLQWTPSASAADGPVQGYTVYWCPRNPSRNFVCKLDLHWTHLPLSATNHTLVLDASDMIYGVSAEYGEDRSSGLNWADCIYDVNAVPPGPPPNIVLSAPRDYGIHVSWEPYACSSHSPYITGYIVNYCKHKGCSGDFTRVEVHGGMRSHDLINLASRIQYGVSVLAISDTGPSAESKIDYIEVTDSLLSVGESVGVAIGTLFCVIVMGAGISCIIRRCKNARRDFHIDIANMKPETEKHLPFEDYPKHGDGYVNSSFPKHGDGYVNSSFPPNLKTESTRPDYRKQSSTDSGISSPKVSPNGTQQTPKSLRQFDYSQVGELPDSYQSEVQVFTVQQGHMTDKILSQDSSLKGQNGHILPRLSFQNQALSDDDEGDSGTKQGTTISPYIYNSPDIASIISNHEKQKMLDTSSKDSGLSPSYSKVAASSEDDRFIEPESADSEIKCKDQLVSHKHAEDKHVRNISNQEKDISFTPNIPENNVAAKNPYLKYDNIFKSQNNQQKLSHGDGEIESKLNPSLRLNSELPTVQIISSELGGKENHSSLKNDTYIPNSPVTSIDVNSTHNDINNPDQKTISLDSNVGYSKIGEPPVDKISESEKGPSESLIQAEPTSSLGGHEDNHDNGSSLPYVPHNTGHDAGERNAPCIEGNIVPNPPYVLINAKSVQANFQNNSASDRSEAHGEECDEINLNTIISNCLIPNPLYTQFQGNKELMSMPEGISHETIESKPEPDMHGDRHDSSYIKLKSNGYIQNNNFA